MERSTQEQHQPPPPSSRQDLEAGKGRMFQHKMALVRKCHSLGGPGQSPEALPPPLTAKYPSQRICTYLRPSLKEKEPR